MDLCYARSSMSKASKALLTDALREYMRVIAATGGKRGGKARARKLTAKRRREIAREAARARWRKTKRAKVKTGPA